MSGSFDAFSEAPPRMHSAGADRIGPAAGGGDGRSGGRRTASVDDLHAGDLAVDQRLGRGDHTFVKILLADRGHRTGQIVLLADAVADDHDLLDTLGVGAERDVHDFGGDVDRLRDIANIGDDQLCSRCRDVELICAVEVRGGSHGGADHLDRSADERHPGVVGDGSRDFSRALAKYACRLEQHCCKQDPHAAPQNLHPSGLLSPGRDG